MNIKLYNNKSVRNKVYKNLTQIKEVSCQLLEPCSIEHPQIIIQSFSGMANINYIFIPDFGRYYFVDSKQIIEGNKISISASVDVLSSFFGSCGSSPVIASRSASHPDYRIDDPLILKLPEPSILIKNVGCSLVNSNNNNYVLTLSGK